VRKIPGVRHVEAQFFTQTLALECCAVGEEIRLVGIEPSSVSRFALMSPDGERSLGSHEIIAGGQLIARLGWKGSSVELLGDVFRIAFQLESTGTGLDESILMPIASARKLAADSAALQPVWKEAGSPDRLISALLIEVDDPAHINSVAESLDKVSDLRVLRPAEAFQRIKQSIGTFSLALAAAGLVTLLVSVVHLFSHIASVAWDRKGEWALYRALGATRARLFQFMVGEALALSLGGAVFGLPIGAGLYHFTLYRLLARNAFPVVPPGPAFLAAISLAAFALYGLIGLAAAIGPAVRVAKLQPALIMAQGDIDP
jgi:putative ABC transport system permease protein